jgi:hypothetical protein
MKTIESAFRDEMVNIKLVIASLWIALMFVYLYADFLSLYRPGLIDRIIAGYMGPFKASQTALALAGLLMLVSIVMVPLSLILPAGKNRWVNIVTGLLLTLVGIANLLGDIWIYYLIYGLVEIVITLTIVTLSLRWPRAANS